MLACWGLTTGVLFRTAAPKYCTESPGALQRTEVAPGQAQEGGAQGLLLAEGQGLLEGLEEGLWAAGENPWEERADVTPDTGRRERRREIK